MVKELHTHFPYLLRAKAWPLFIFLLVFTLGCHDKNSFEQTHKPPNIIVIMVDDMGFSDISPYGGEISTPTLEGMAENGALFTQFYNAGRCAPTRASLLTGLYPHKAGVGEMVTPENRPGYYGRLAEASVTSAEVLKEAGYQTFMSGKWHVTHYDYSGDPSVLHQDSWPLQRGFDRFFGTISGAGSYYTPKSLMNDNEFIEVPDSFYYTTAITDSALSFIQKAKDDTPFYLYMAHVAPHWPLHAPKERVQKYVDLYTSGWDKIRIDRLNRQKQLGFFDQELAHGTLPKLDKAWDEETHQQWQAYRMAVYAAQLEMVDEGIAKVIQELKKKGIYENTMLVFLSDNGGSHEVINGVETRHGYFENGGTQPGIYPGEPDTYASYGVTWATVSNTPYRLHKSYSHEGGIISPLLIQWPSKIDGSKRIDSPSHVIDILPTLIAASGAQYPKIYNDQTIPDYPGKNLLESILNQAHNSGITRSNLKNRALFWEHIGNRAVRQGDWKLVAKRGEDWELYKIKSDPTEAVNLAKNYPEKVEQMSYAWLEWAKENYVDHDE